AARREPGGPCWTRSPVLREPVVKIRLPAMLALLVGGTAIGAGGPGCQKREPPPPPSPQVPGRPAVVTESGTGPGGPAAAAPGPPAAARRGAAGAAGQDRCRHDHARRAPGADQPPVAVHPGALHLAGAEEGVPRLADPVRGAGQGGRAARARPRPRGRP